MSDRRAIRAGRRSGPADAPRAYTMLELLLVLAIVGLAGVVVAPRIAGWGGDSERRALRLSIISLVRGAQAEATARGAPVTVRFDPGSRALLAGEKGRAPLPAKWRVEAMSAGAAGKNGTRPSSAASRGSPKSVVGDAGPVALMVWSPGGLVSASRWRVVDSSGVAIEVESDAIEGATIR